jgi:glycosyltransferase involved in cell wall biosynthesis
MISIQIITKNNESTIQKTLESIKNIKAKIFVADVGSIDKTTKICEEYKAEIINLDKIKDYSLVRNELIKEGINFYINPWEVLVGGHEILETTKETTNVYVFQNNLISKEIRIWEKEKFKNPVYETIINQQAKIDERIVISSKNQPNDAKEKLEIVEKWMKNRPLDLEPYYYMATSHLSARNYDKFLFYANEYCNRENKINNSLIMMKYYEAQVKLYTNKIKEAAELTLTCLSYMPSYAEFWCLLGDIFYHQKKWDKSKSFYENAIIIGRKRKNKDELPIEILKYKEYPEQMIKNIEKIKNSLSIMG